MTRLPFDPGPDDSPPSDADDLWRLDRYYVRAGYAQVAGVDEAGRGALAGPVVAAAVVLPPDTEIAGVRDSKQVDERERWELYRAIRRWATSVAVGIMDATTVDEANILRATHRAMATALVRLAPAAGFALIDGLPVSGVQVPHRCIVKGDGRAYAIAAASIVAKVTRDCLMADLDAIYPGYGFAEHKGYGTTAHHAAILQQGPCPIHRRSFEPVARLLRRTLPGL